MLPRAAKKHIGTSHLARHLAAASLEQLRTPWLCPAVTDSIDFRSRSAHIRPHTRLTRSPGARLEAYRRSQISTRQLATEAAAYGTPDDYIPWEGLDPHLQRPYQPPEWGLATLKPFDTNNALIIPLKPYTTPPTVKRVRYSGFSGDTAVLQENLYALIRVGRHDQAAKVVRRMAKIFQPDAPELIDAHHHFLTGQLDLLLDEPSKDKFAEMQRWFELDIRGRDAAPNSGILAIMIKASLAVLEGSRLDRTIRRYVNIADQLGSDVKHDTLTSLLFLDDELVTILRLFPQEFEPPEQTISVEDFMPPQIESHDEPAAEVLPAALRSAEQKGLGLKALKKSLGSMSSENTQSDPEPGQPENSLYWRQRRLERDVLDSALDRWREEAENTQGLRAQGKIIDPLLGSFAYGWIQDMVALVKAEVKASEVAEEGEVQSKDVDRLLLGPFLRIVKSEKLCAAAVLAYVNHINDSKDNQTSDRSLVSTVGKMGTAIAKEIQMEGVKNTALQKFDSLPSPERRKKLNKLLRHQKSITKTKAVSGGLGHESPASPNDGLTLAIRAKLGAMFLSLLMRVARLPVTRVDPETGKKVTQTQPVVTHTWQWRAGKRIGMVKTNPELISRLKREPVGTFIAKFLPMIVQPQPWRGLNEGPYFETPLQAVRFRDTSRSQHEYVQMASKRGDMKQTYAALDVIGKVPWRVNKELFSVLTEAWNSGDAIGGLAPENPPDDWPEKPPESDTAAHRRWKALIKVYQNERTGLHSQRCYQNFQLEVARSYLNETFYCPHNVDFRGRAYPIPPYFNHMGADYVRGLFMFANGKALGETGLKWLKIHLANVYGYDKSSLKDRELFTMEHIADVYDSASNPLNGKRWWLTSDDPWQTLAACMELKNALESPDPTKFVSHIPVQQDGTCNGLQHYAALGGDVIGAQQVNLMPSDRPADIYTAVAEMVKKDISEAAALGDKTAQILDGKITRKVVKQPVMTNVYGVTYHGARDQVKKQLVDILPKASLDNHIHLGLLARYVAVLIFKSLSKMFNGAHAIQHWLGECGGRISQSVTPEQIERIKARRAGTLENPLKLKMRQVAASARATVKEDYQFKSTIVWTTPLGMPVVQPYREPKFKSIKTSIQDLTVQDASLSDPVSKRKQLQGFPPNFIHSLDATHMMLSALKCDELGLQFSSVHDSFWTHAADVPIMNRILRDAFVRMHTEDVIGRLREEFLARYKGCMRYAPIDVRSPLAKRVRELRREKGTDHRSFFSATVKEGLQVDELLEESERLRLLNSDDPEDQLKGREMITPGSLFQSDADAAYLLSEAEGQIPLLGEHNEPDATAAKSDAGVDVDAIVPGTQQANASGELDVFQEPEASSDHSTPPTPAALSEPAPASMELPLKEPEAEATPSSEATKQKKKSNSPPQKLFLWLPTDFPAAPEKGGFDVASLKDSQYFFS